MTRTYVSKVVPHSADAVWAMVKDFREYRWGEGVGEARIENGLDANTPGAIRSFAYYGKPSRQRLVAYSTEKRMQSWESVEAFDPTLSYYKATLRITPVTISDGSFVEWWSDFEATSEATPEWQQMQQREFGKSLDRLASLLDRASSTAYHSTVLDHPVATVWQLIRDFNNYPIYIEGVTESVIEDDKRGDEVGAVRRFRYGDQWIRQRLAAHSDQHRSLTYVGLEPFTYPAGLSHAHHPAPVRYEGTIHLLPIMDGTRTFIEWSVSFDAVPDDVETWRSLLLTLIPEWTDSLRKTLAHGAAEVTSA